MGNAHADIQMLVKTCRASCESLGRLMKKGPECFEYLSMNGKNQ